MPLSLAPDAILSITLIVLSSPAFSHSSVSPVSRDVILTVSRNSLDLSSPASQLQSAKSLHCMNTDTP